MDLEPIDIDINMNQNVSEEAQRAASASDNMTNSVNATQKKIDELNTVIRDMTVAIAEQEKLMANSDTTIIGATRRLEVMHLVLEKAEKELNAYRMTTEQANEAIAQGADVASVMNDVTEALAETESRLTESTEELVSNQEEINNTFSDAQKSTNAYSTSNQILSGALKRVCSALGIESTQVQNVIGDVHSISAAKKIWIAVTTGLTTAQKALVTGGIGAVITALGFAIAKFVAWYKAQQNIKRAIGEVNGEMIKEQYNVNQLFKSLKDAKQGTTEYQAAKDKILNKYGDYLKGLDKEIIALNNVEGAYKAISAAALQAAKDRAISNLQDKVFAEYGEQWSDKVPSLISTLEKAGYSKKTIDAYLNNLYNGVEMKNHPIFKYMNAKLYFEDESNYKDIIAARKKFFSEMNKIDRMFNFANLSEVQLLEVEKIKKEIDEVEKWTDKTLDDRIKKNKKLEELKNKLTDYTTVGTNKRQGNEDKKQTNAEKQAKELETATSSLKKKTYDYQKRIDNARVKAIHEGAEQERAAIRAEYNTTQAYILKELSSLETLEKKTGKPATEQRTKLIELDVESTRQYHHQLGVINTKSKKQLDTLFAEVNARFTSDLERNLLEINIYYDKLIEEARKYGATLKGIQQLEDLRKQDTTRVKANDTLRKLDLDEALQMEKAANLEAIGLTTIAEQTKYEIVKTFLEKRIALLRALGDEASNKEADILEEKLKGLQSPTKSISGLVNGALFNTIKKGFAKVTDSEDEADEKTKSFFASFQKGGTQAVSVINDIKSMFGGLDEGLDKALDAVGNIAQGFAAGGIAGGAMAVIGEGIKMFTSLAAVEKEHQEALRQLALAKLEMQREYNLLLLKEELYYKQGSNIFGTNQILGAANSILTYRDTIAQLKKEMKGDKPNEVMGKLYEQMANSQNGLVSSIGKQRLDEYKKQLDAYNKGIGALANVDIVTGSRKSGWGFWKKRKDVYSGLLDTYDDVIDKEGKLNTNRIQAILNTHKMSDENKALLESLLKLDEVAKQAEEQLESYLTQTFGSLGDALTDSIVTAFANGTDAAELFKGNVTDVLNDIAKQMVFGLYLKDTFDKLEKDIKNAYKDLSDDKLTEEQLSEKITNILGGFFGGLGGDLDKANKFLEEFWKNAEANGFDRPEGERKGATGGFATASQDSIFELNGHMYATRQLVGDIRNDQREELLVQRTITGQLSVLIERSAYWEYLKELPTVVKKLEDIESYGIPMKIN